ncbi:MAG: spermidine synthase [Legionella sp.]|nr:MAG: spermidine synthase [Legionella sp.]
MLRFLFPITLFFSAFLLFSIQPMVAKTLLPIYGGTPAVWTVCMLFFQCLLLSAYAYVWLLSQSSKPVLWRSIHSILVLLSLITLPLILRPVATEGAPEWNILCALFLELGLPLLVIGASAPLLQFAYSHTTAKDSGDPYFLYVASNAGSLLALVLYPWCLERYIGLSQQFYLWNIGYGAYLILLALVLFLNRFHPLAQSTKSTEKLSWPDVLLWIFLSFIPCSMMLGVTLFITSDVAATPLFWVLPLALYLLTFIIAFNKKPLIDHGLVIRNSLFFLVFTLLCFILGVNQIKAWQLVLFNLLSFFVLALLCHGELYLKRPPAKFLPVFYFCLSLGGALAGVFNGLLAPHWFNDIYEYPIAILLSLFALPKIKLTKGWWSPAVVLGLILLQYYFPQFFVFKNLTPFQIAATMIVAILVIFMQSNLNRFLSMAILFVFIYSPLFQKENVLLQQRNFYGVKQVKEKDGVHVLISHSTIHGLQVVNEKKPIAGFTSYYGALEEVIHLLQKKASSLSVTIIGLGAGTMVCQHRETDELTVIEIDQQMIDLAKNSNLFTYLRDCSPKLKLIKNDGRLAIAELPKHSQNLIILDAFNSDAIPVHLMTLEAFILYKNKLKPKGVILVNISNRHVKLLPVLTAIGRSLNEIVLYLAHQGDPKLGQFSSEWAILTTDEDLAFQLMAKQGWHFMEKEEPFLWTDDYSNIVPLMNW